MKTYQFKQSYQKSEKSLKKQDFAVSKKVIFDSLGIYTKSYVSVENKEIGGSVYQKRRNEKFDLLNHVQEIIPHHRTALCLKTRISKDKDIDVMFNPVRHQCNFGNLVRCGSVWTCPVCSAKISQQRKQEVGKAINKHRKNGGDVILMTLTNPHKYNDSLSVMLDMQAMARKRFWETTKVRNVLNAWGCVGHITSLEITHGDNGWHPHYHILVFVKKDIDFKKDFELLYRMWAKACTASGLDKPSLEHGLDLRDGSHADKYVTKWGLADEITRSVVKVGKKSSKTPFDLLRESQQGDTYSQMKFLYYVGAIKNRRQLIWSRGLKKLLEVKDKSDEIIANETDKCSEVVKTLPFVAYQLLKRDKQLGNYLSAFEHDISFGANLADKIFRQVLENEIQRLSNYSDEQFDKQKNKQDLFNKNIYLGLYD